MSDPLFRNIVTYRLNSLRVNAIEIHEVTIDGVHGLLPALDRELGHTRF